MTEQPKSIIEQVELTPLIVLQDEKKAEELFKAIKAEVAAFVYDLTTDKGRKAVNQDFHGASIPPEPALGAKGIVVALADGISSSDVSDIAAESTYMCESSTSG